MSRLTVADCRHLVGIYYNIPKDLMCSRTRKVAVARPRQMAMHLAREMTDASLTQIGQQLGMGDHTSVLHGADRIEELIYQGFRMSSTMDHFRLAILTFQAQQAVTLGNFDA